MNGLDALIAESRCYRSAVDAYLRGGHVNLSTRVILEAARVKLGFAPPPQHAECNACRAVARRERLGARRWDHKLVFGDGRVGR